MKLSNTLLVMAATTAIASCSNDKSENPPVPSDEAIAFNASAPLAPRSVITTGSLTDFRVTAFVDGKEYMNNVLVTKHGGSWTYTPTMYWPADKEVNFFSYAPGSGSGNAAHSDGKTDLTGFVNDGNTDLLYGVNMHESGEKTNMVTINFRHALSQIRFAFTRKTENPPIRVDVMKVDLVNILSQGDFNFPHETTSQGNKVVGEWSNQSVMTNPVIYSGPAVTLTDNPKQLLSSSYIFAVPQTLQPSEISGTGRKGSFVRALCAIYHEESGLKLWPTSSTPDRDEATGCGYLYFPLDASGSDGAIKTWDEGKAYRYNISIGVPKTSSAIQFDVTVDQYENFANPDLEN